MCLPAAALGVLRADLNLDICKFHGPEKNVDDVTNVGYELSTRERGPDIVRVTRSTTPL